MGIIEVGCWGGNRNDEKTERKLLSGVIPRVYQEVYSEVCGGRAAIKPSDKPMLMPDAFRKWHFTAECLQPQFERDEQRVQAIILRGPRIRGEGGSGAIFAGRAAYSFQIFLKKAFEIPDEMKLTALFVILWILNPFSAQIMPAARSKRTAEFIVCLFFASSKILNWMMKAQLLMAWFSSAILCRSQLLHLLGMFCLWRFALNSGVGRYPAAAVRSLKR
jgi:hypothetical protein